MSETFPFGDPDEAIDPPVDDAFLDADVDAAPEPDSRRTLVLGGVAAALAFGLGAVLLVGTGSDPDPQLAGPVPAASAPAVPAAPAAGAASEAEASPVDEDVVPATFDDVVGRDPFLALVAAPAAAAPGAVAPGATAAGAAGTGSVGTGTGPSLAGVPAPAPTTDVAAGTSPSGTAASAGSTPGGSTAVVGRRVSLVDAHERDGVAYAQTKVGDEVHTPRVGETFAGTFRLLTVQDSCATYLNGDEQFALCEGQEVLK